MKFLVAGFYGHQNLGDEMFMKALEKICAPHSLIFREIAGVSSADLEDVQGLIVGGGDLLNDFYGRKISELATARPDLFLCGVGLGISFEECRTRSYLQHFDHLFVRNRADLWTLNTLLGSAAVSTLPDLGFSLPLERPLRVTNGKKFVLLLVGSVMTIPSFLFCLCNYLERLIAWGFHLECLAMYTENKEGVQNDLDLCNYLQETFGYTQALTCHPALTLEEFFDKLTYFDYGLCMRYHGHVFCTRRGLPFLSLPLTRKCSLFLEELPENCRYEIPLVRNDRYQVQTFDRKEACRLTKDLLARAAEIRSSLLEYDQRQEKIYRQGVSSKIRLLLEKREKRTTAPIYYRTLDPEKIYQETLDAICRQGINPLLDTDFTSEQKEQLAKTAASLCYRLTNDTSNPYLFGTISNLQNQLPKLREIIFYIYSDLRQKITYPPLNIEYMHQHSFRGLHRAGWQFAIDGLLPSAGEHGILVDTYCDRSFHWAADLLQETGVLPYSNYWIGFIHHTFETEFARDNNNVRLFANPLFLASLPVCRGLFVLSRTLAQEVRKQLQNIGFPEVPVGVLTHPTAFPSQPELLWSWANFRNNPRPRLTSIGSWYREPTAIFRLAEEPSLPCSLQSGEQFPLKLSALRGRKMEANFLPAALHLSVSWPADTRDPSQATFTAEDNLWARYFARWLTQPAQAQSRNESWRQKFLQAVWAQVPATLEENSFTLTLSASSELWQLLQEWYQKVEILETLSNQEYDQLTSSNLVFLSLVDASVANTVIECLVRHTPLVINRIPPTEEFLGPDYPLFYQELEEVPALLTEERICQASRHLAQINKEPYRLENFREAFLSSPVLSPILAEQRG